LRAEGVTGHGIKVAVIDTGVSSPVHVSVSQLTS
jgi:hypothetical protein